MFRRGKWPNQSKGIPGVEIAEDFRTRAPMHFITEGQLLPAPAAIFATLRIEIAGTPLRLRRTVCMSNGHGSSAPRWFAVYAKTRS